MRRVFRCTLYAVTITLGLVQVTACSPKTEPEPLGRLASFASAKADAGKTRSPEDHALRPKSVAVKSAPNESPAQRDFPVTAMFVDERHTPRALWLISNAPGVSPQAMEFFTAEHPSDVRVEAEAVAAYSFTDAQGRRHSSVHADPSDVDSKQASIYADWERDGTGHDVVLGAYLFENEGSTGPHGVYLTKPVPVDPKRFFGEQPVCEPVVYVARTQGSPSRDVEDGFKPRTKIVADYDAARRCWSTRPLHALDLHDNTFVLTTATRVVRLNSEDLTPAGAAPDIRIIDIKEE